MAKQVPLFIHALYGKLVACSREVRVGGISIRQDGNYHAELFEIEGPHNNRNLRAAVSHITGPEEMITVAFRDMGQPLGKDSLTRHYQPMQYLGKRDDGTWRSSIFRSGATRRPVEWMHLDIFEFLKDGKLPVKEVEVDEAMIKNAMSEDKDETTTETA